jgi:hypothetical protein
MGSYSRQTPEKVVWCCFEKGFSRKGYSVFTLLFKDSTFSDIFSPFLSSFYVSWGSSKTILNITITLSSFHILPFLTQNQIIDYTCLTCKIRITRVPTKWRVKQKKILIYNKLFNTLILYLHGILLLHLLLISCYFKYINNTIKNCYCTFYEIIYLFL